MFRMFDVITLNVTRRCPWDCVYCDIKLPMNNFTYPELSWKDWKKFFDKILLHQNGEGPFVLVAGAEPFAYPDLLSLLEYFNDTSIMYTVITTGRGIIDRDKFLKVAKGVSTTIDLPDYTKKSKSCLELLKEAVEYLDNYEKPYGIVGECTMEHSRLDERLSYYEKLLEEIPEWIIDPAYIEPPWNEHYDFANLKFEQIYWLTPDDFDKIMRWIAKPNVYNRTLFPKNQMEFAYMNSQAPKYKPIDFCNPIRATNIEPNGSFRLCYRIKGELTVNVFDFIEDWDNASQKYIEEAFREKKNKCIGCYWSCPFQSMLLGPSFQSLGIDR